MKKFLVLLAISAIFLSECKTDFKLTSKWKEQMVIYGLLSQSDTVQYIRINKTYLGEANAYTMGGVYDSINYKYKLNVKLEKWYNGSFVSSLPVDTTTKIPQNSGTFASSPNQILYKIRTRGSDTLRDDAEYRLTVVNPVTGYTATSKTQLVAGMNSITGKGLQVNKPSTFISFFDFFNLVAPFKLEYSTALNGKLYETILRFYYTEISSVTGSKVRYIEKNFGTTSVGVLDGYNNFDGQTLTMVFPWSEFKSLFAALVSTSDPTIYKRVFGNCELIINVAADEFNTYMEVNKPVTTITGDKPTYTNIQNGIGIFSARYTYRDPRFNKPLSNATIDNAVQDPRICNLHFADRNGNVICP